MTLAFWAVLPTEIIEEVVSNIDEPKYLAPLLLTCKELQGLVQPHLQLRRISCSILEGYHVWELLASNKNLSQHVRHVEIWLDHFPETRLPFNITPRKPHRTHVVAWDERSKSANVRLELSAERLFVSALRQMSQLLSFKWHAEAPLIDSATDPSGQDVWTSLQACRQLHSLDVSDRSGTPNAKRVKNIVHESKIWDTSAPLRLFSYVCTAYNWTETVPDLRKMSRMLERTTCLQELYLNFSTISRNDETDKITSVSSLLASAYWPHLRVLHLYNTHCSPEAFVGFVYSHPTISELHIQSLCGVDEEELQSDTEYDSEFPLLKPGSLPALRRLACTTMQAIKIIGTLTMHPRPIERVGGITFEDPHLRDQFLCAIATLPYLNRLELVWSQGWEDVARIGQAAPNLRWLHACNNTHYHDVPVIEDSDIPAWINAIRTFHNLIALHSVNLLFDRNKRIRPHVLGALTSAVPSLRRMDAASPPLQSLDINPPAPEYLELVNSVNGSTVCLVRPAAAWVDSPLIY